MGYPHYIKGQGIYAYVTLVEGVSATNELATELRQWTRKEIGPIATGSASMGTTIAKNQIRQNHARILRKIAANEYDQLGDVTLQDPAVVDHLVDNRQNR